MRLNQNNLERLKELLLENFNYIMGCDEFNNLVEQLLNKCDSLVEQIKELREDIQENYIRRKNPDYEYEY